MLAILNTAGTIIKNGNKSSALKGAALGFSCIALAISPFANALDDGCMKVKSKFVLNSFYNADGSIELSGPVRRGLLGKSRLEITALPEDVQPGLNGLTDPSKVAVKVTGAYKFRNGEKIFVEVIALSDYVSNRAAGLHTILGGTGRFKNATGSLSGVGIMSNNGSTRHSEVEGWICLDT